MFPLARRTKELVCSVYTDTVHLHIIRIVSMSTHDILTITPEAETDNPNLSQKQVISRTVRDDQSWILSNGTPPADACETKVESPSGGLHSPKVDSSLHELHTPGMDSPSCELRSQSPLSGKVTSNPPVVPTPASGLSGSVPG